MECVIGTPGRYTMLSSRKHPAKTATPLATAIGELQPPAEGMKIIVAGCLRELSMV